MNFHQNINRSVQAFFLFALLGIMACNRGETPLDAGTFEINFTPVMGGQTFEVGFPYENVLGRSYQIDMFRMYVADITLVKEDGSEVVLSEIELFDVANGGETERRAGTAHGTGAYKIFEGVEAGNYRGVKFGIGVPDRLNTEPADYASDHPLSVGNSMYWSWRTGYKFMAIEGKIDSSQANDGAVRDHALIYHTGKDSVNSPNSIYRTVSYLESDHAFTIEQGKELQFVIEMDINRMFYTASDTIDMVENNTSHSVPGEQFDLAKKITDNLIDGGLYKVPF